MEPEKFEAQIKDHFKNREIKPSVESWEKLQTRLEHQEKSSGVKFKGLAAVAAVVMLFFIMGTYFTSPVKTVPEVVNFQKSNDLEKEVFITPQNVVPEIEESQVVIAETPYNVQVSAPERSKRSEQPAAPTGKVISENRINTSESEPKFIPLKKEEILLAEINPHHSLDAEVDALLLAATAEIEREKAYEVQTASAAQLLNEVEYELEMSFRQKVFEVLKDGYAIAKNTLANRN